MRHWPFYLLGLVMLAIVAVVMFRPRYLDWSPDYTKSEKNPYGCYVLYNELESIFPKVETVNQTIYRFGDERNVIYDDLEFEEEVDDYADYDNFEDEYNDPQNGWEEEEYIEADDSLYEYEEVEETTEAMMVDTTEWYEELPAEAAYPPLNLPINYLFVTTYASFAEADARTLMYLAGRGGSVFIAANEIDGGMAVALGIRMKNRYFQSPISFEDLSPDDTVTLRFVDERVDTTARYTLRPNTGTWYFSDFDSARTEVLAVNDSGAAVLIRFPYGQGMFLLASTPEVFSNYHLLDSADYTYLEHTFAYLPSRPAWWDEYYKPGAYHYTDSSGDEGSSTQFIDSQPPLAWAYYLLLGLLGVYLLFGGKRRQRIVPVIPPWRNTTVDFVRSMGHIYFQRGDNADLAQKKIAWFNDQLRLRYRLDPSRREGLFYDHLARISGESPEQVTQFFQFLDRVHHTPHLAGPTILELDRRMQPYLR